MQSVSSTNHLWHAVQVPPSWAPVRNLTDRSTKPGQRIKTIRRDARYAVLGHTIWLGGVYADSERIICDGANNVLLEYDFTTTADDDDDADKGNGKTR